MVCKERLYHALSRDFLPGKGDSEGDDAPAATDAKPDKGS